MSATHFFTAYEVQSDGQTPAIPAFFIESTAPDNFDDKSEKLPTPDRTVDLGDPRQAIERIAETLARQEAPKLVITVHGFNSPREAVLKTYAQSFETVNGDKALHDRGVVCVGFRWPSERMGTPWRSGFAASPIFLLITLFAAIAAVYFVNFVLELCDVARIVRILITAVTAFMAVVPITLYLLQLIVYFRDGYRATTYGVPDLVDIIRLLDDALAKQFNKMGKTEVRADLSFIGHSMGGYVVTNVVRILTDVFSPAAMTAMKAMTAGADVPRDPCGRHRAIANRQGVSTAAAGACRPTYRRKSCCRGGRTRCAPRLSDFRKRICSATKATKFCSTYRRPRISFPCRPSNANSGSGSEMSAF